MPDSDRLDAFERRIIALEEAAMHSDHLLGELSDVLRQAQDRLDRQDRAIERLIETTERLSVRTEEKRTLEDERPPHY